VIADADNGYGNAIGVIRTVREYIQTGVAGIHLEDQVIPKRCGHVAGRMVIPLDEAVGKYRAADAVRRDLDPDFLLIARTDARGAHGGSLEEAIRRANAYLEAGADMAFVEGPTSVEEVRRICKEVHGPVFYNQTGVSPRFSLAEMNDLGLAVTILPGATLRVTVQAVYDFARDLRERGPAAEEAFNERYRGHPLGNLHRFRRLRPGAGVGGGVSPGGRARQVRGLPWATSPGRPERLAIAARGEVRPCPPCSRRSGSATWSPRGPAVRACSTSTGSCCTMAAHPR
jgi:2-methylisocitrate lyase-like PEP mutase family enzyme